jgi:raffinose/stachyose/melibiose transport system permease protein
MTSTRSTKLLLLEILMFVLAIIFIYPIILIALNSVKPDSEIITTAFSLPKVLQYANFSTAWTMMKYPSTFMHSLIVTVGGTAGIVAVSSTAGFKMSRTKTRYSTFLFFLCITPMIISFSSIMITLVEVAKTAHLMQSLWGLMIIYWGLLAPSSIFLYHGFAKTIPNDIDESASMDGCSPYLAFVSIIFPLLMPITSTVIVLNALAIWNDFLLPLLVIGQSESTKTLTLATYIFQGNYTNDWGLLLAGLLMTVLPIIIFFIFMQRFIINGITTGAVKG